MFTINRKSVFGQIYEYWQSLEGGKSTEDQETLCHFASVILFWTWWNFFWKQDLNKWRLRPYMIVFGLLYVYGLIVHPTVRAITIAGIVTVLTIIIAIFLIRPIWNWFWGKRYANLVYPWTITLALMHSITFLWFNSLFRRIVQIELIFGVSVVMFLAVGYLIGYLKYMFCREIELV